MFRKSADFTGSFSKLSDLSPFKNAMNVIVQAARFRNGVPVRQHDPASC